MINISKLIRRFYNYTNKISIVEMYYHHKIHSYTYNTILINISF